eukprot:CAMPEP_0115839904 /NCGR_PEP_ID=MMETSP0287-20121206/6497_1 /TAXON_ID=412157 /ORGANISM="Chrysochromulina rotalis, Strain UIO044" /LENGTH=264 /DNA_ID=CAMNT_0003293501 /DNA_START=105 /DNA_END=899 /DNA_ORIENTATION=-
MTGGEASNATFQRLRLVPPSASVPLPPKSVHRRELPEALTAFSSDRGREYFREAMALGHMEPYFPLIEQFVTQEEPTFCGLGTLTMVMNALRIDPRRRWRDDTGPGWRWWSDEMFPTSCTGSLDRIRVAGVTMEEFARLASANGALVEMRRPTDEGETLETFRSAILTAASSSSHSSFTVASFDRAALGQTGGGHFSPIGGYHAASDAALILDVARFKYPPYWVPLSRLWDAALEADEETGRSRGWFTLEQNVNVLPHAAHHSA